MFHDTITNSITDEKFRQVLGVLNEQQTRYHITEMNAGKQQQGYNVQLYYILEYMCLYILRLEMYGYKFPSFLVPTTSDVLQRKYICTYTHALTHTFTRITDRHVRAYVCMHVCVDLHIQMCVYAYMESLCVCVYTHFALLFLVIGLRQG